MSSNGSDISRGRKLTVEEAAAYATIRQQVMEEIPPAVSNVVQRTIEKLRQLREELGVSLAEMENQTGMTHANLCGLETEERDIQLRTLERYARALGHKVEVHFVPVKSIEPEPAHV
jgi:DNA-binding Xre family transcriptional regulator